MSGRAKELRIVYLGTPEFAVTPLRQLVEGGYNVVGVVTTPDRPAGRGQRMRESDVKRYALKAELPIMQPENLTAPQFLAQLEALEADLGIVVAFRMLPKVVWAAPRLGTFNLHASLLPQYRGAAPINWAVINGEKSSGVTTFMLDSQIDTGDILFQTEVEITNEETAGTLHDKLMYSGADLVLHTVEEIAAGRAKTVKQPSDESGLKPAPKIFREDCKVEWGADCTTIHNLIRGLSPYPAAWSNMVSQDGEQSDSVRLFLSRKVSAEHSLKHGTIVVEGEEMRVACADGYIAVDELQMEGKRRMATPDFLRGFREIESYRFE